MDSSQLDLNAEPFTPPPPPPPPLSPLAEQPGSPPINSPGLEDFDSSGSVFVQPLPQELAIVSVDESEPTVEIPDLNEAPRREPRHELTATERRAVYEMLLANSVSGVLKRFATREAATVFGVGIRTVQRLWKRAQASDNKNYSSHRPINCGRKRVAFDLERIRSIPLRQRTTLRSMAFALGVSKSFLHEKMKEGVIRRHTNAIKPSLTPENHTTRINYCLSGMDTASLPHNPTFNRMDNTVHIDEKWFYLTKKSEKYYLMHNEPEPVRTTKSSHFIPKVMFLAAVARPMFDCNGIGVFDGKIGIFPLVQSVVAVRSSQNRPRGTVEIKPIANITRSVIREFLIGKVLPAIAEKWPRKRSRDRIYIQQDNAKTHIGTDDVEFLSTTDQLGLNVSLIFQPPNSPDLNVLDLGFFRAIQSLQAKECAKSIVELIAVVEHAYQEFTINKSNRIFLTLQSCMIEVMKCDGSNNYKIPHLKKEQLQCNGTLPATLQHSPEVYRHALSLVSPDPLP